MRRHLLPLLIVAAITLPAGRATTVAQAPQVAERVDLDAIYRIKDEGLLRSQVMDTAWQLTEAHGPRLTNSPNIRAAAGWATKRSSMQTPWMITFRVSIRR